MRGLETAFPVAGMGEVAGAMVEEMRPRPLTGDTVHREYPLDRATRQVFRGALTAMNRTGIPYAVGGAFGLHWYTSFWRVAKDLDLFILPEDVGRAMQVLLEIGFTTRIKHPEWLADAVLGDHKVDLIFGMGNWSGYIDHTFFDKAPLGLVLGVRARLLPPEEMIYSKAFVASRERYDAADLHHLLIATGEQLDWPRLLDRFGENWEVLLSHLVMFRYVYPSHRNIIPPWVLDELLRRFQATRQEPWQGGKLCRGFLLDGIGTYSLDITEWGYRDARQETREDLQRREKQRLQEAE